jgi:hypothetical protein
VNVIARAMGRVDKGAMKAKRPGKFNPGFFDHLPSRCFGRVFI